MNHLLPNRGVTLLEVLFSMLIAAIGLLGAIALLPVAIEQANKGRQADAQVIAGEAAVNDFKVRGYHNWNSWVWWNGTGMTPGFANPVDIDSYKKGVCFDPLLVSYHRSPTPPTLADKFNYFPALASSGEAQMIRVGIFDEVEKAKSGKITPVPFEVAETCMKCFDELLYDRPKDRSADPIQRYSSNYLRRETEPLRDLSWFATLSPSTDGSDEYILAIVVVQRRQLPLVAPNNTIAEENEERYLNVTFNGLGESGGEVTLTTASSDREFLNIRRGEWVMLSAHTGGRNHFRWYRVIDVDPDVQSSSRNISMFGCDWPSTLSTKATIIPGVIAVFERTIRLQENNLW